MHRHGFILLFVSRDAQNCSCLGWYASVLKRQMRQNTLCMRFSQTFWGDLDGPFIMATKLQISITAHLIQFYLFFWFVCLFVSGYSGEISYLHLNFETTWPSIVSHIRRTGHLFYCCLWFRNVDIMGPITAFLKERNKRAQFNQDLLFIQRCSNQFASLSVCEKPTRLLGLQHWNSPCV